MKLQHNLGGLENLGPVSTEPRPFVQAWEKRIFGIHVAMMALSRHLKDALPGYDLSKVPSIFRDDWTWGHLRTGAEGMNPFDYFKYRYYEKWLGGISGFFVDKQYIADSELAQRSQAELAGAAAPVVRAEPALDAQVIRYLREGDSPKRSGPAPRFARGETVRVKDVHPVEHTRLPGYLRDKQGVVDVVYDGSYAYFFATGDGIGDPMPVYCVKFRSETLWGEMHEPGNVVYADLFETYLEKVDG